MAYLDVRHFLREAKEKKLIEKYTGNKTVEAHIKD